MYFTLIKINCLLEPRLSIEIQDNVLKVLGMIPSVCNNVKMEENKNYFESMIDIKPVL